MSLAFLLFYHKATEAVGWQLRKGYCIAIQISGTTQILDAVIGMSQFDSGRPNRVGTEIPQAHGGFFVRFLAHQVQIRIPGAVSRQLRAAEQGKQIANLAAAGVLPEKPFMAEASVKTENQKTLTGTVLIEVRAGNFFVSMQKPTQDLGFRLCF